jgi:hypothetical protein
VVYARIFIDFADLIKRVVSFESMLKRAKSLRHLKMAQKPVFSRLSSFNARSKADLEVVYATKSLISVVNDLG